MEATGLLMDVKRFAVHDGPGIRTTLFLKGCPLTCIWCHNPEGIYGRPQLAYYAHKCITCGECAGVCPRHAHAMTAQGHVLDRDACAACGACEEACLGEALKLYGRSLTVDQAVQIAMEDVDFYAEKGGVTLSGGEPLLQRGFTAAFLEQIKRRGVHTAVDTCGCVPWEAFESVLPYTDLFLYDIKHIDPRAHQRLTGKTNEAILRNIRRLSDVGARIEVRLPLVPGYNDDQETLERIGDFLSALQIERVKVLPYHALARSKYRALGMRDTMPEKESPTDDRLHEAAALLRRRGADAVSGRD